MASPAAAAAAAIEKDVSSSSSSGGGGGGDSDVVTLNINHHGTQHTFELAGDATLAVLHDAVTTKLSIPADQQKFMVSPRVGLLKPPPSYADDDDAKERKLVLRTLVGKKIQLLAPLQAEMDALAAASKSPSSLSHRAARPSVLKAARPARTVDHARAQADATYTFGQIVPLGYLPRPERSARFLERLRDDAGIRAAMRTHRFRVGVLTEMDPAAHTTHESRTLGLNRNAGAVIELRLRTDAYDGYRDYRTIRRTLCHELAHNVWGDHDRNFWALTRQIEAEVERADWTRGGRSVGETEFYNPDDGGYEGNHADAGGWTGGEFVLGGGGSEGGGATTVSANAAGSSSSASSASSAAPSLSRRELMAKAAEERLRKQKDARKE